MGTGFLLTIRGQFDQGNSRVKDDTGWSRVVWTNRGIHPSEMRAKPRSEFFFIYGHNLDWYEKIISA